MNNEESNDKELSDIMRKSMLRMPLDDFEDRVMFEIHRQARHKKKVFTNTRLSRLFFLLGTGFGLTVNNFLTHLNHSLMGFSPERILLFFQVSFVFFFLMQSERIFKPSA